MASDYRNTMFILGNGFDLSLGLKTRYSDFISSDEVVQLRDEHPYINHLLDIINYPKGNENFNPESIKNNLNWIDLEIEIKETITKNDGGLLTLEVFNLLKDLLKNYLQRVVPIVYTKYLSFDKRSFAYELILNRFKKGSIVYNFNYTNSLEVILDEMNLEHNGESTIEYVHGRVTHNDIILGFEDNVVIKPELLFAKKAVHKHYKAISLSSRLQTISKIYFFGHSLGETDEMVFKPLFFELMGIPGKEIFFYYYGQQSYYNLFHRLDILTSFSLSTFRTKHTVHFIDCSQPLAILQLSNEIIW